MNQKKLVTVLGLAGFIVMADNWVVSPILPAIAKSFHVDPAKAGILIAAYMLPFGLFQLAYGPLADRFGKLKVIVGTLAMFAVATALCGAGLGLTDLGLYRALTGLFAAATMPVSLALIGDVVPLERRQEAIGTFMGISFLGQALSMGIGGTIAYFASWRAVFVAYAAVAGMISALLAGISRKLAGKFAGNARSEAFSAYARLLGSSSSLRAYSVILFEGAFILGSFSYLGANISRALRMSYLETGLIMTVFGVGAVLGGRLGDKIAKRTGKKSLIALGLGLGAAADLAIAFVSSHLAFIVAGIFALGLGFMLAHSTLLTLATEFARKSRGVAMSMVTFCFMVGGSVGTAFGGRLIGELGYGDFFALYGFALLVLSAISLAAIKESQPRSAADMAA